MKYKLVQVFEVHLSSRVIEVDEDLSEEDAYYRAMDNGKEIKTEFSFYLNHDAECHSSIDEPDCRDATENEIRYYRSLT